MTATISETVWGHLPDGRAVKKFVLINRSGARAELTNFGAAWLAFYLPEHTNSVVCGCDSLPLFLSQRAYLGATVGRYANRIGYSRFKLDGAVIDLTNNLSPHHLHGGAQGFSHQLWDSHIQITDDQTPTLTFSYLSKDGEEGYPGELQVTVKVTLSDDNRMRFEYLASTNAKTIVNLTNHAYFNLGGEAKNDLQDHRIKINATQYLAADENALPTGELFAVEGSVLDLTTWTDVQPNLAKLEDPILKKAHGYDHCYVFNTDGHMQHMAQAKHVLTGIQLDCYSTLPGLQFYTGNFMGGTPITDSSHYHTHGAFCFEPGFWPDSPNHDHFPDCTITPENPYTAIIEYHITTKGKTTC